MSGRAEASPPDRRKLSLFVKKAHDYFVKTFTVESQAGSNYAVSFNPVRHSDTVDVVFSTHASGSLVT